MPPPAHGDEIARAYAEHTLDEIWLIPARTEPSFRSITRGAAIARAGSPESIEATTDFSGSSAKFLDDQLVSIALLESHRDGVLEQIGHSAGSQELSVRTYFSHRIDGSSESLVAVIRVETAAEENPLALLTTPRFLSGDLASLMALADIPVETERAALANLPMLWSRGTGGVLLHESAGHPAGIAPAVSWPGWLRVVDNPGVMIFETPVDKALEIPPADLLSSERPGSLRRASFRDHPMPRLSTLVASGRNAPFDLPARHIEIELAEGGSWDPLTDRVTVKVLFASLVDADRKNRIAPFEISTNRADVARSILGGRGEPVRYPGVLCSDHGQRIPVGTSCLDLLTEGM